MGGVNFTRNRAWWHTAIWDEYNQRHQYLMIIPTFAFLLPYYWHGAFLNRDIEQNFAAKMYQLDYEQKRNRLTHNLIMEHFETHVESVNDILDSISVKGFDETFKEEIENGLFNEFPKEKDSRDNFDDWSYEKLAEFNEYTNKHREHNNTPLVNWDTLNNNYISAQENKDIFDNTARRKYPNTPMKFLHEIPLSSSFEPVERFVYTPTLNYSQDYMKSIKQLGSGGDDEEEE
jgi:hypothetical protein